MPKIIKNGINYASGSDWLAQENSEGFISNKPPLNSSIGTDSIVEGQAIEARGQGSHAEGVGTIAPLAMGAHVQGKYNADFENTNLVDVVGWGDDANTRKNISALTADGQLILKRSIKIGANDDSTGGIYLPVPGTGGGLDPDKTYSLTSVADTMYWRVIPDPEDIPKADEITIISDSENILSIAPYIVPTPDGITLIADSENVFSIAPKIVPTPDGSTLIADSENVFSIAPYIIPTPDGLTLVTDSENVLSIAPYIVPTADGLTLIADSENILSIAPHLIPTPDGTTLVADSENVWSVATSDIADEVTIITNSEGKLEAVKQLPDIDNKTIIVNGDNKLEAVIPVVDWLALENSEGFINNKPNIIAGSDYDESAVVIGDIENNEANESFSLAEGTNTTASGRYSHAEGDSVTASGEASHAEGTETLASGKGAHAEGQKTVAAGAGSHAEGIGTYTNVGAGSVRGKWNVKSGSFIDVVGGGTNDSNRVNLSALVGSGSTAGRLILKDSIVIGANPNSTGGYVIPVPDAAIQDGESYVLSYNYNDDAFIWTKLEVTDTNKYQRDPSASGSNNGPFTIYDGTTEPASTLGKPGDIYFKHS